MNRRTDIDPKSWGPPAWLFLDAVLHSFPENALLHEQLWMIEFLTALGDALPCEKCRGNYKTFLQMYPIRDHANGKARVQNWLQSYKQWSRLR